MTIGVLTLAMGLGLVLFALDDLRMHGDDLRMRRAHMKLKLLMAEATAAALGNSVLVDGVELPKPNDERWRLHPTEITNTFTGHKRMEGVLVIGTIRVSDGNIFVEDGAPNMPRTDATENYCAAVWKAYRNRVARTAIESAQ